jgi:hypothetical protein
LYSLSEIHAYNFNEDPYDCFNLNSDSWIGKKVIIKNNGYNLFITRDSDTVKINTLANLNEQWNLYNFSNGDYINATVILHEPYSFLGVSDSVKTIELQVLDYLNNPIEHELNNKTMKLSKNHGFIEMFNFRDFSNSTYVLPITKYTLFAISDSINDLLSVRDVYDYNIADEFHIRIGYTISDAFETKIVIDKYYSADLDTVFYVFDHHRWGYTTPPWPEFYHYHDTISENYTNLDSVIHYGNNITMKLPLETILPNSSNSYVHNYLMYSDEDLYNGRLVYCNLGQEFSVEQGDSCYHQTIFDSGSWQYYRYIKGCGDVYTNYSIEQGTDCIPCSELVYFKKGDEEWGNSLSIPLYYDVNEDTSDIKIFPNPTSGKISIQAENIDMIEVINELGITVLKSENCKELDLSKHPKGVYLIQITIGDKTTNRKIVKYTE